MSPKYKHLAAAWALAVAAPVALAAVCSDTPLWGRLAPPAWASVSDRAGFPGFAGFDDCSATLGAAFSAAGSAAEPDLTSVSLYGGARFITWDAAPLPFALRHAGLVRGGPLAALRDDTGTSDAGPTSEALALLLTGFLGVGVGALRRREG